MKVHFFPPTICILGISLTLYVGYSKKMLLCLDFAFSVESIIKQCSFVCRRAEKLHFLSSKDLGRSQLLYLSHAALFDY